ncbi:hypothetical protein PY310_07465 [Pseudarthrobacter sp. H3Y2-7]|uniref:hypothetical protein n=1 Tax=Pseudarthrobacter naphthalenicus TaxID=3031328 RepID=UPI0023AEE05F|nr:hypothetical protein [Pseudarthrobacter sp. H3Y2-7]MDE8668417.1 hypothetical protein [Pseudarthrobacter sp. H3Y2-7]
MDLEEYMRRTGLVVQEEDIYLLHDVNLRRYWEFGENAGLSSKQRYTLLRWARSAAGQVEKDHDHGKVVYAVAQFVHDAMPPGDIEGTESPPRRLAWIIDTGVGECGVRPPHSGPEGKESVRWVCINAAQLAAGMLRELGYPVRECNVILAQNGSYLSGFTGAVYQEAALQVWFTGGWHWVDPYLLIFDPAATRDDSSRYKVDQPCYWSGTTTPISWLPGRQGDLWVPFGVQESLGSDLHKRFYPRKLDDKGCEHPHVAGSRVRRISSVVDRRGGTVTSGIFIRTPTPGVTLSLEDALGRKSDAKHREIPGSIHIARGTPFTAFDTRVLRPAPGWGADRDLAHHETIFFGTQSLLASWEEIGHHPLVLTVEGPARASVEVSDETTAGDHVITVCGLPPIVRIPNGSAKCSVDIYIDPLDAQFHSSFSLLAARGFLDYGMYWPATVDIRAIRERSRIASSEEKP